MTNISLSTEIFKKLAEQGVSEYVFCSGSRNAPLIESLKKIKNLKKYSFFDERSAAFFALGKIKSTAKPVAVITTSGTAVAELLPACIEAYYSGAPLILITADRPVTYRGSGAPQSIEQIGLFSKYVSSTYDLSLVGKDLDFKLIDKPIHINVCFDEPLIDDEAQEIEVPILKVNRPIKSSSVGLPRLEKPLVILSGLASSDSCKVFDKIKDWDVPFYVEGPSCLRSDKIFSKNLLRSGDRSVQCFIEQALVQSVVRIGNVPTLKAWRQLEAINIPVVSISRTEFKALSREVHSLDFEEFLNSEESSLVNPSLEEILKEDEKKFQKLKEITTKFPHSEPVLFKQLSEIIGQDSVFIGNSLPIREWDLMASYKETPESFYVNRGANGIDGLVSTFLGAGAKWLIIGDLSALYDLSALWAKGFSSEKNWKIIVINNKGGQIFSRIYKDQIFQNKHEIDFSHWAKLFGIKYLKGLESLSELKASKENIILELNPNNTESQKFWEEYEKI